MGKEITMEYIKESLANLNKDISDDYQDYDNLRDIYSRNLQLNRELHELAKAKKMENLDPYQILEMCINYMTPKRLKEVSIEAIATNNSLIKLVFEDESSGIQSIEEIDFTKVKNVDSYMLYKELYRNLSLVTTLLTNHQRVEKYEIFLDIKPDEMGVKDTYMLYEALLDTNESLEKRCKPYIAETVKEVVEEDIYVVVPETKEESYELEEFISSDESV